MNNNLISLYKDKTIHEIMMSVCVKTESNLSEQENILFKIIIFNNNKLPRNILIEMQYVCSNFIYDQCIEVEFFQNRLKQIESCLMNL